MAKQNFVGIATYGNDNRLHVMTEKKTNNLYRVLFVQLSKD